MLPHALPELVALFLPLAAWTIASRRDEWRDLLAATFVTVAIAIPVLVAAATWEVYVWPQILAGRLADPDTLGADACRRPRRRAGRLVAEQGAAEDALLLLEEEAPQVAALEHRPALGLEDRAPRQPRDPLG